MGWRKTASLFSAVAKTLAGNDDAAAKLRTAIGQGLARQGMTGREIVEWLRASPLVGVDWYSGRPFDPGRKIDL